MYFNFLNLACYSIYLALIAHSIRKETIMLLSYQYLHYLNNEKISAYLGCRIFFLKKYLTGGRYLTGATQNMKKNSAKKNEYLFNLSLLIGLSSKLKTQGEHTIPLNK